MEFDEAINEHLELQRRNARLEPTLPLGRYRAEPMLRNDRLSNQRTDAVSEETEEFSPGWLAASKPQVTRDADSSRLWDGPPLFEWGD